jgi:hypothetical protein
VDLRGNFRKATHALIDVIEVDQDDNTYLSAEGRENLQEGYDEVDTAIRARGRYVSVSGLCLPHYNPEVHVIPPVIPPASWTHYRSLDHGFNNPTAAYWHAVDPKTGVVVTYKEHYKSEWTIQQHAEYLLQQERELREDHEIIPFLSVADPAIRQRSAVTGLSTQIEYGQHGINWALGNNEVHAGIDKMDNYLRLNKWFITEDCPNLQKEARKYRWAQYATGKLRDKNNRKEEPMKKDDHGLDSTRYFFSFMPDLNPDLTDHKATERDTLIQNLLGAPTRVRAKTLFVTDPNLSPRNNNEEVHFVSEVGEF